MSRTVRSSAGSSRPERLSASQALSRSRERSQPCGMVRATPGGHPARTHQPPDLDRPLDRAAGGMKVDRQLAFPEPLKQRAQPLRRRLVDRAVRRDPFAAPRAAGIRLALGEEERDRRRFRLLSRDRASGCEIGGALGERDPRRRHEPDGNRKDR